MRRTLCKNDSRYLSILRPDVTAHTEREREREKTHQFSKFLIAIHG